jgi:succinylglutamate desuccinylase
VLEVQRLEVLSGLAGVAHAFFVPLDHGQQEKVLAWIRRLEVKAVVCHGDWQGTRHWMRLAVELASEELEVLDLRTRCDISSDTITRRVLGQE